MSPKIQLEPASQVIAYEAQDFRSIQIDILRQGQETLFEQVSDLIKSLPEVTVKEVVVTRANGTKLELTITRPPGTASETLPPIIYCHGGGWVFGSKLTHRKPVYELTVRSRAAVVFVNYSLSPEVRFPVAIEECYDAVAWVANKENAHSIQVDPHKIIIAGDSAGGYLAAVVSILAKQRGLTAIKGQALIYPITDSKFDTESYKEFANGYDLTADAMEWFWNHYLPDKEARKNTLASPLQASIEDLRDLPRALVITAEADVLRDEAEAYARKLLAAGNDVVATRYLGIIHGILDIPKAWSPTADAIMDQVANWSKQTWKRT